jgi:hypothetical protein
VRVGDSLASLRQPDQRSCGATCLVVARALLDDGYAQMCEEPKRFREEVLAMHRRTTSLSDVRGRVQLPWPRAIGTPPWAMARQLEWTAKCEYDVVPLRPGISWPGRSQAFDQLLAAEVPAAIYVGDRWLPRHVVLVIGSKGDALDLYDPGRGVLAARDRAHFLDGELSLSGWQIPWLVVAPRPRRLMLTSARPS